MNGQTVNSSQATLTDAVIFGQGIDIGHAVTSNTQEIIIDEEFKHLMPPLGDEAYAQLTENLQKNGCLHPLILWKGILIDGHNRFEICTRHNIQYSTVNMDFPSREAAMLWIIELQSGRRNLTPTQITYLRGVHYRMVKHLVSNVNGINQYNEVATQNGKQPQDNYTSTHLAEKYKVSKNTIVRDAKASEGIDAIGSISTEAKKKVLTDEVKLEKKMLTELASASVKEITELAEKIENGTYEKIKPEADAQISTEQPFMNDDTITVPDIWGNTGASDTSNSTAGTTYVTSDDSGTAANGQRPPQAVINSLTNAVSGGVYNTLAESIRSGSTAQIKDSIRAFISILTDLYVQF